MEPYAFQFYTRPDKILTPTSLPILIFHSGINYTRCKFVMDSRQRRKEESFVIKPVNTAKSKVQNL